MDEKVFLVLSDTNDDRFRIHTVVAAVSARCGREWRSCYLGPSSTGQRARLGGGSVSVSPAIMIFNEVGVLQTKLSGGSSAKLSSGLLANLGVDG